MMDILHLHIITCFLRLTAISILCTDIDITQKTIQYAEECTNVIAHCYAIV